MDIPSLVIVGGHEPQKTIELSYEWHQQIPGSEFAILPDAYPRRGARGTRRLECPRPRLPQTPRPVSI